MMDLLKRLALYTREMFPMGIYLPYAAVSFSALYLVTQLLAGTKRLLITSTSFIGLFTVFGVLLLMRILDEFKDYEVDKVLFPHRPVPRGDVRLSDLRALGTVLVGLMIGLNLFNHQVLPYLGAMLLFGFLTFKWFFLEDKIRANLVLALVTHQPMALFVNLYVISAALSTVPSARFEPMMILPAIIFFFPVAAWETGRKIRARGKETEYVTYSSLFGPERAALLPLSCVSVTVVLSLVLGALLDFSWWFSIFVALILLVYAGIVIRFIIDPVDRNNIIKPATETCVSVLFLLYVIQIVWGFGITVRV